MSRRKRRNWAGGRGGTARRTQGAFGRPEGDFGGGPEGRFSGNGAAGDSSGNDPAGVLPAGGPGGAFALDGYINRPAFLGEASRLLSGGSFVRSDLTRDTELLTTLYRENWLAKKIIDMPAEDMTRAWYTLNASIPAAEADALRRLEAKHAIRNEITHAIKWARLYGGAIALIVIRGDEGRERSDRRCI